MGPLYEIKVIVNFSTDNFSFMIFYRLIRFNKRLKAIFNTLAILTPRIISIMILLILVYYFYAIIGMEVFRGKVYQGCCNIRKSVLFGRHIVCWVLFYNHIFSQIIGKLLLNIKFMNVPFCFDNKLSVIACVCVH